MRIIINTFLTLFVFCIFIINFAFAANTKNNIIKRFAIVVGANNGGYNRKNLQYAISDANSFMTVLRNLGGVSKEDSMLLFQPDKRNFYSALRQIYLKVTKAKKTIKKTEIFFYYSGHSDEEGILLENEKVTYKELKNLIKKIPADVRIAILDSCSSGAFTQIKGGKIKPPFMIDSSYDMKGNAFMTSSSKDEASQESDKIKGSFFTHFLVSGLRGAADITQDNRITLNEAYQFAYNETLTRTEKTLSGPQHANYNIQMSGTGDVILTDIRKSSTKLILSKNITGKLYIRDNENNLVTELYKPYGRKITIGLGYDKYRILKTNKNRTSEAYINLLNQHSYTLKDKQFISVNKEFTIARGTNQETGDMPKRSTLLKFEDLVWGGSLTAVTKFSKIDDVYTTFVGGKISAIINHQLKLGAAGYGLIYPSRGVDLKGDEYQEDKPYVRFGYGGFNIEYLLFTENLFSFSVGTLIGAGGLTFSSESKENSDNNNGQTDPSDAFFVIEPEITCFVNIIQYVRFGVGVSYRKINGLDNRTFSDNDFTNFNASIFISGGWF